MVTGGYADRVAWPESAARAAANNKPRRQVTALLGSPVGSTLVSSHRITFSSAYVYARRSDETTRKNCMQKDFGNWSRATRDSSAKYIRVLFHCAVLPIEEESLLVNCYNGSCEKSEKLITATVYKASDLKITMWHSSFEAGPKRRTPWAQPENAVPALSIGEFKIFQKWKNSPCTEFWFCNDLWSDHDRGFWIG